MHPFIAGLRAVLLMICLLFMGFISALLQLVLYPLLLFFDKDWVFGHRLTIGMCYILSKVFIRVEIKGLENIPVSQRSMVIVSNHQSTLDMLVLAALCNINFYVVFKRELLFYPGLGQAMWLAGYIPVNRNKSGASCSGRNAMSRATALLRSGTNTLWFPEGTRKADTMLGPFKPGAFICAAEAGATLLPVTISGAKRMMPAGGLPKLFSGDIVLTIHAPIPSVGKGVDAISDECRAAIESALRPVDRPPTRPACIVHATLSDSADDAPLSDSRGQAREKVQ